MIKNCPVCGKAFDVLWPQLWRYRKEFVYFCSWKCLRKDEENEECEQMKVSLELKKKAVEIAVGGGDVMSFLIRNGVRNPAMTWGQIKRFVCEKDPVAYEKIVQAEKPEKPEKKPDTVKAQPPTLKVDGPLKIETKEPEKVEVVPEQKPLKPGLRGLNKSDFEVSAIRHPQLGEFYYDKKFNSIDWRTPEGEEISLHPSMWKELYMIIPDVMGILQVVDGDE